MIKRVLASVAALGLSAGFAAAEYKLTILHTNDFHSRIEPINAFNSTCDADEQADGLCFGGTARLVTAVEAARARTGNSILVDGGDQFQGSLFYTYYKGQAAAEFMNRLGYDAMTVGNHEFDDGPEVLRGFVDAVDFPILMSNADISAEFLLAGKIEKSVVLEVGGEPLGLVGLTPANNHDLAQPGPNITFSDPVEPVQAEVDRLTALGINKIIVLSHSGFGVDQRVARETTGIDVIVGGHSNTYLSNVSDEAAGPYPTVVNGVQIVQAYAYGKFLGELHVVFDDEGRVISAEGEPLIMDNDVAEDEATVERIAELAQPLDEIRNKVVAQATDAIEGDSSVCRVRECAMGNLVADALLDRVAGQGVTIAFANAGGLRASLDPGDVTMGEVFEVLPFQNTLSTFEISGQGLIDALEHGVARAERARGRFPQVAGVRFAWDPAASPGARVSDVMVNGAKGWEPIDPQAIYRVATNDFIRNGGDGYEMFEGDDKNAYDFGPDIADVVAEYLTANSPYTPYLDGRIEQK